MPVTLGQDAPPANRDANVKKEPPRELVRYYTHLGLDGRHRVDKMGGPLAGNDNAGAAQNTMLARFVAAITTTWIGSVLATGCARPLLGPIAGPLAAASAENAPAWDWAQCLHDTVRDGQVYYARLNAHPAPLDRVLAHLADGDEPSDKGPARTARLINTYNAFAMRAGLERYRDAGGDPDRARAPNEDDYRFRLHGREVTLADIRARLSGGQTPDVRVPLALCSARAGVPLADQPFAAATLDRQLSDVAAAAMKNPNIVRIDHENQALRVADVIWRNRFALIRGYERRTGAKQARLLNALLDLAEDADRDRLNTAVGYAVAPVAPDRRLNVYAPAASE